MKFGIRGLPKKAAEPLARAIDRTANDMGLDDVTVLRMATYLWQHIADEVARGHVVAIPGFGAFGACLDERKRLGKPIMRPVFSPAQGFKAEVSLTAPYSRASKIKIRQHRSNHRFDLDKNYTHKRTWSTMGEIRDAIDAQMSDGKYGVR